MLQLRAKTKSLTCPPLSIARYSFIQLSQLGRQWRERKCPIFETIAKGDSNPGSTTITFDFAMLILRPIRLLSCSIGCSSCGVYVHKYISSAKRRVVINSPSIFTSLFSQFNRRNILSSAAVNNLGEKLSPCLIPLLILILPHSLCADVLSLSCPYFRISMYESSIPFFTMMSVSRGFVLWQMPSRNPRTQHTVVCCIRGTSL